MTDLQEIAPAFVKMAHETVWAACATVDTKGRPRSRVWHPIWQWDGESLVGWVATGPTPVKMSHLKQTPFVSVNYWATNQDTCTAECHAKMHFDLETREKIWNLFLNTPMPVGYDPKIVPGWTKYDADAFAVLRLDPWRLRVFPGTVLLGQGGEVLNWKA